MRIAILALALLGGAAPALAQDAPDRAAILATVERHFAARSVPDAAAMAAVAHPGAMTVLARYDDGGSVRIEGGPMAGGRANPMGPERLLNAEVWQDGDVAAVWAPSESGEGNRLQCGYAAIGLVRVEGRWQISSSTATIRPDACATIRAAAVGPPPLAGPEGAQRRDVLAAVDSFFTALRRRDTLLLDATFTSRASWVTASYRGGQATIGRRPAAEDKGIVVRATTLLDERLLDAVVRSDGDVAMVWGPYQFRVGDRLSHCGHDLFHLTRAAGAAWRIEGGAFTIRPDGCARLIGPRQVDSLPSRGPDATVSYGADRRQFGELRLPSGAGPFPVAVVIHGGCWQRSFASLGNTAALADALRNTGIATWNIEYRTADEPGGAWPGTFHDVSDAIDHLRVLARLHPIDTARVITVGHSAGGHLAVWAAARPRLPDGSALRRGPPLRVGGAVALGPVMDLGEFAARLPGACGRGANLVVGGSPIEVPERHAEGAPLGLLPLRVRHAIVVGALDGILPAAPREAYVRRARAAGDDVRLTVVPDAGHFEVIAPNSAGWPLVLDEIRRMLFP